MSLDNLKQKYKSNSSKGVYADVMCYDDSCIQSMKELAALSYAEIRDIVDCKIMKNIFKNSGCASLLDIAINGKTPSFLSSFYSPPMSTILFDETQLNNFKEFLRLAKKILEGVLKQDEDRSILTKIDQIIGLQEFKVEESKKYKQEFIKIRDLLGRYTC